MTKKFASMSDSGFSVLTIAEVAQVLKCEESAALSLIESGQLKSITVGGVVKVSERVLACFLGNEDSTSVATLVEQQQRAIERIEQAFYQSYTATHVNDLSIDIGDNDEEDNVMAKLGYGQGSCYYSEVRKRFECQFPIVDGDKVKRKLVWGTTESEAIGKMAVAKQLATGTLISNVQPIIIQTSAPVAPVVEPVREKHLVSDVIDRYLEDNYNREDPEKSAWKPANYVKNKDYANKIRGFFEGEFIEDITTKRLKKFCIDVVDKGNGEKYAKRYTGELAALLKVVFRSAKDDYHYISENPYNASVKKPDGKRTNSRGRCLSEEQWTHLLRRVKGHPRYETMIILMYLTGMRIGEVLALDWKNVDLIKKVIKVVNGLTIDEDRKFKIGDTKTECSDREIPLRDEAVKLLLKWKNYIESDEALCRAMKENGTESLVFPNTKGMLYDRNSFWDKLKLFVRRPKMGKNKEVLVEGINFPFTPHYLRHTFATNLSGAGVNIQDIRDLLGHGDIAVTANVYLGVNTKRMRKAVDALSVNL